MKAHPKATNLRVYGRQPKSYLDRHSQRSKISVPASHQSSFASRESSTERGISHRGSKIVEVFHRGNDPLKMRIEQQGSDQKPSQNQFLQAEIMWFQKINEVKAEIEKIRNKSAIEQKTVRELEKERDNKRNRLAELKEKLEEVNRNSQETAVEDNIEKTGHMQEEYDRFVQEKQGELALLRTDRGKLIEENGSLLRQIEQIKTEIQSLSHLQSQNYNANLSALMQEEDELRSEIVAVVSESGKIEEKLRQIESKKPLSEEVHRKYLELYEKMLVNRELDKFENLMKLREQDMDRLEDYQLKKAQFKDMKKEVDLREKRTLEKQRLILKLENDIKEKSTTLMILVNEEQEQQFRR